MAYTPQESQITSTTTGATSAAIFHQGTTFLAGGSYTLTKTELLLVRQGAPPNILVELQATTAGEPNNNVLASQSVDISTITEDDGGEWVAVIFDSPYLLTEGVTYAIVVTEGYTNVSNRYKWRYNNAVDTYADGQMYYATTGENWLSWNYDMTFKNYSTPVDYVDLIGTGGGIGGGSAVLETTTVNDLVGTGGGTGSGSAALFVSGMPSDGAGMSRTYKRVVAASNDQIYYEDI